MRGSIASSVMFSSCQESFSPWFQASDLELGPSSRSPYHAKESDYQSVHCAERGGERGRKAAMEKSGLWMTLSIALQNYLYKIKTIIIGS